MTSEQLSWLTPFSQQVAPGFAWRSTGTDKEHVFLFQDNGAGIPQKARENIFNLFHREAASFGGIEGCGLGLAIVKEIAERHGGKASLEYRPEGGASFRVALPKTISGQSSGGVPLTSYPVKESERRTRR